MADASIPMDQLVDIVHGDDPEGKFEFGGLSRLGFLLSCCRKPGAFEGMLGDGDNDDFSYLLTTLEEVETMYLRLAELTGYRTDAGLEDDRKGFERRLADAEAYAEKHRMLVGDVLAGVSRD